MVPPVPQPSSDSQLLNLKVPPHSIDAEQSVLGGLLIDNGAFDKVGDIVSGDDFYRDDHRRIFRHISRLVEKGKPADVVTVDEAIKASEDKDKTGGITYLAALAGSTPSAHNVRRYAEIVRECAVLRKLIEVSTEIADSALNRMGKDVGQLLDEAESKIFQIAEAGARTRQGFMEIQPLLTQVMERIDLLYHKDNPSDITGIPTGYRDLDRETSGLQQGDLIIIAVRPSMGKTALALNMAEHVAVENKLPVAVFSMEMSRSQLAMRMLGSIGRLDRAGRRADPRDLPRGGLDAGCAGKRHGRNRRPQAAQRPHRHGQAGLPRGIHTLRKLRAVRRVLAFQFRAAPVSASQRSTLILAMTWKSAPSGRITAASPSAR